MFIDRLLATLVHLRHRVTDPEGRLLCCGQTRPGAIHDLTEVSQAGLVEPLDLIPGVTLLADANYRGLSAQTAGAVITPCPARRKSQIPVPLGALSRHLGRREHLDTSLPAVAGLVPSQNEHVDLSISTHAKPYRPPVAMHELVNTRRRGH